MCVWCSGNRLEAVDVMAALLIKGVAVFTFDFLGCGQSDGDFVTLGVGVRAPPCIHPHRSPSTRDIGRYIRA